jgi:hypothetical protein
LKFNIRYFFFKTNKRLEHIFFGLKYRAKGIISITEDYSICRNIEKTYQILPGYFIGAYDNLNTRFLNETNLEMKTFKSASLVGGRIITDLGRNLGIFDKRNFIVEELTFTYVQNADGGFCHGIKGYKKSAHALQANNC